jgi:hypothetical protein
LTLARSLSAWRLRSSAAVSTWPAAVPVSCAASFTPEILAATPLVPCATSWMLWEISRVAAPCSSTAAAIADAISFIWPMVPPIALMASTARPVSA